MKVIINVPAESAYSKYNFLTFEVDSIIGNSVLLVALESEIKADFSMREVIVVDFDKTFQAAYDNINWNSSHESRKAFSFLNEYALIHNICHSQLKYNCPA
jgi:hypothetical protein